jgi:hypothetical protein
MECGHSEFMRLFWDSSFLIVIRLWNTRSKNRRLILGRVMAVGAWYWPPTSIYCRSLKCVELYLRSPRLLYVTVPIYCSTVNNITLSWLRCYSYILNSSASTWQHFSRLLLFRMCSDPQVFESNAQALEVQTFSSTSVSEMLPNEHGATSNMRSPGL